VPDGRAILALEDGRVFKGRAAGARTRRGGEVVFNTSLTGYQEVFTDPSYSGQIVCLTYPHIGNVGTNAEDEESPAPYIEALVVREFSPLASNYRSHQTTQDYLEKHGVPVIWDVDTRALVRHLRSVGALRGVLSTDGTAEEALIAEARKLPTMAGQELASRVTSPKSIRGRKDRFSLPRLWRHGLRPGRASVLALLWQVSAAGRVRLRCVRTVTPKRSAIRWSRTISGLSRIFCGFLWITAAM